MIVEWLSRELLDRAAAERVRAVDRVLDIGPGIRPQGFFRPRVHLCAEPHAEYVDLLRNSLRGEPVVVLHATGQDVVRLLPDDAVNTVFLLDVIEHLEKNAGAKLLAECERVADTQVVVFTPLGFARQEYQPGEADAWGLGGAEWQTHRSGWTPEEFEAGWTIFASEDYHRPAEGAGESFGAFWAIKDVEAVTATTALTIPKLAALASAVPPTDTVESRVLAHLLDGMPPGAYSLLSSGRHDLYETARETGLGRMWLAGIGGLPGRTFDLSAAPPAGGVFGLMPEIARRGRRAARVLRDEGCEALVACSADPLDLPAGMLAARLAKLPLYVYLFEDVAARFAGGAHRRLAGLVDRVVKRAQGVIVSNDTLADRYRLRYGVSPTVVYSPAPPPLDAARSTGDEAPVVRTLTYAGGFELELLKALAAIGAAAGGLPEPVELTVYAVDAPTTRRARSRSSGSRARRRASDSGPHRPMPRRLSWRCPSAQASANASPRGRRTRWAGTWQPGGRSSYTRRRAPSWRRTSGSTSAGSWSTETMPTRSGAHSSASAATPRFGGVSPRMHVRATTRTSTRLGPGLAFSRYSSNERPRRAYPLRREAGQHPHGSLDLPGGRPRLGPLHLFPAVPGGPGADLVGQRPYLRDATVYGVSSRRDRRLDSSVRDAAGGLHDLADTGRSYLSRRRRQGRDQRLEAALDVHVLLPVHGDEEVTSRLEPKLREDVRLGDCALVAHQHLVDRKPRRSCRSASRRSRPGRRRCGSVRERRGR
jgi:hypothetical protein